jgi:transcriptional regulator with XRE-family HTH domain
MKALRKTISEGLLQARKSRGLSQSELATLTGLKPSAVSHFETARRMPTVHNLLRLACALNVSLDALFGRVAPDSTGTPKRPKAGGTSGRKRKQKGGK